MTRLTLTFTLCAALASCGKKTDKRATPPETTAPGRGSAGTVVVNVPADAVPLAAEPPVAVPTEVDFEDQARAEITEQNLVSKLSALEKELAP